MGDKPIFKVEGRTIRVPHKDKIITFVAPHFGPSNCNAVGKEIDSAGLLRPTFAETVSLVYSATKNRDNKYTKQVLDILNDECFWGFNTTGYKPEQGAFISDRKRNDVDALFRLKIGEQSLEDFVKNPIVLALAEGEEGAKKLVKIAKSLRLSPYVYRFECVNSTQNRVSVLYSYRKGHLLYVTGSSGDIDGSGCAFGLLDDGKQREGGR